MDAADGEERRAAKPGARRRRARPRAVPDDDRPRGYQPQRMQRLWRDIDHARDRLGLGPDAETSGGLWGVAAFTRCASELTASAAGLVGDIVRVVPGVLRTTLDVAPWLLQLPILGRLLALLPIERGSSADRRL